jgi:hypothetical protein
MAKKQPEPEAVAIAPAAPTVAFLDGPMRGRTEMPADAAFYGNEAHLALPTVVLVYALTTDVGGTKTYRLVRTEPRRG